MVVPADPADPAGDEVRVARVLALHEDRVAAEDRAGAVALRDPHVPEVDLRVDAERAHDPGDRVPGHLGQALVVRAERAGAGDGRRHASPRLPCRVRCGGSPGAGGAGGEPRAVGAPLRLLVEGLRGDRCAAA